MKGLALTCQLVAFFFLVAFASPLWSQGTVNNSETGMIDFNVYPYLSDVDDDNSVTINLAAKLKHRFSYFSLTNFGNQSDRSELSDSTSYYTEQNIRWAVSDQLPLDLTVQMNFRTGDDNDRHRLGLRWRLDDTVALTSIFDAVHLKYSINWHAVQFDDQDKHVWQLEHVFKLTFPYLTDRLYLAGFIDHTFNEKLNDNIPSNPVVAEVQLGYRVIENFFLVTEYRINQYRRSDVNNLAIGIQYTVNW